MRQTLFSGLHPKKLDLRPVKRQYRRSDSQFTDAQMLLLIRKRGRIALKELHELAQAEMPKFYTDCEQDYKKVQNSVNRLETAGKIESELHISGGRSCRVIILAPTCAEIPPATDAILAHAGQNCPSAEGTSVE